MMILIEENQTPASILPIEQFKAHLRLGSGFAEDGVQEQVLEGYLRAAISSIEGRTGQALYQREMTWVVPAWKDPELQPFPLAPIRMIMRVTVLDADGVGTEYPGEEFIVREDSLEPVLRARSGKLPSIDEAGKAEIYMIVGNAMDWSQVPPDLAQAVLLMAAHYYEYRNDLRLSRGCTPFGVTALIERYRPMRLTMGGGA